MSGTVVEESVTEEEVPGADEAGGPDLSRLQDHTPPYLRASRAFAGLVLSVCVIYMMFCLRPIWHTDIWGHLAYGRLIWQTKSLPMTEPLMPLAAGVRFVDTAWLSQLIGFATMTQLGLAGLQGLYALTATICTGLLAMRCYQSTRNGWFSLAGLVCFLTVAWVPMTVIRPQMAGLACFVILQSRMTCRRAHWSDWALIPGLFTAWANLHGSFLMGLMLLGCFVVGRGIDVYRRTGSVSAVLGDDRARRYFLLFELAAVAVLLNPYGFEVYSTALQISSNANLSELTEWFPLSVRESQGTMFAAVSVLLAIVYRNSPRTVRSWEVLALVSLGWSTMWSGRMIVWFAPIAAYLLAVHGFAVWRAWRRLSLISETPFKAGKWSVVAVGLIWIFFAYSPLGVRVVHGKSPKTSKTVSKETPLAAVEYLVKNPPKGQVFNTYEWGDFLLWAGPPGIKVFVNSHAHLVPREVWQAYIQISELQNGWEDSLDRYGVNTIVVDKQFREPLIKKLKDNDKWEHAFEQDGQTIFTRKSPI